MVFVQGRAARKTQRPEQGTEGVLADAKTLESGGQAAVPLSSEEQEGRITSSNAYMLLYRRKAWTPDVEASLVDVPSRSTFH